MELAKREAAITKALRALGFRTVLAVAPAALVLAFMAEDPGLASAAASPRSVTTTASGWSVTLEAKTTTVRAGREIPATLVITNRSSHWVRFDSCSNNGVFGVGLENREIPQGIVTGAVACQTEVHPGRNVFRTKISTVYESCGGDTGRPCPAPLPPGIYHTIVNWPQFSAHVPHPATLTIRLTR